jgi:hypothetical protein
MKCFSRILPLLILPILVSCQTQGPDALHPENLIAWCIVPFDSLDRTPQERADMLKGLGMKKYAYDWRADDLDQMADEIKVAVEQGIEISAVWLWIDDNHDAIDTLSPTNQRMFRILKESGLKTDVWLSFHSNFFTSVHHTARLAKGSRMIKGIADQVEAMGCRLALYNHGDWFGDPRNQIKLIEKIDRNIGLIYNFHHGHHQIDEFSTLVDAMLPYLWVVNLNGMKKDDYKILPLGTGDHEKNMITTLLNAGYSGPFGILGHVDGADMKRILQQNLSGLKNLQINE